MQMGAGEEKRTIVGLEIHAETIAVAIGELGGCAASGVKPCDDRSLLGRHGLHRQVDTALEPHDALGDILDPVQIIQQRHPWRRLLEVLLLDTDQLAPPIARAQLIALGREARSHQIPQRLMIRIRLPHPRQIPSPLTPRQLLGHADPS
jgi:hypothetical protein